MLPALGWGALAASSLLIGVGLALVRSWSKRTIGLVLSFGAGALISAVAFELFEEGTREADGQLPVAVGLAAGALTYFAADRRVERRGESGGLPLALGALLDGIPEQAVLGIGLAGGGGVSIALLVAIFVSNLPEGIGSAADMLASGWPRARVVLLWSGVAAVCVVATLIGYAIADFVGGTATGAIDGFAAGALLVMLADSMIPESRAKAGLPAGLALVFGFAVAAGLSAAS
jgi:zinc transporter, ZIP family